MTAKKKAAPKAEPKAKTAIASTPAPPKRDDPTPRIVAHMAKHGIKAETAFSSYNAGGICGVCKERIA